MTQEQPTSRRFDMTDAAVIALALVQAILAYAIYSHGPEGRIAVHFDLLGRPNGWADRHGLGVGMGVFAVASLAINALVRAGVGGGGPRTVVIVRTLLVTVAALITAMLAALAFAPANGVDPRRFSFAIVWLLMIVMGAALGKAGPNAFVGVRVYWTLRSRLAWDKANRLLGRILFFGGLAGVLATPFVDLGSGPILAGLLIVAGGGGVLAIIESWRVWRNDPERIP